MFSLLGLPIFHLWLKITTPTTATVTGIWCATQLIVPLGFLRQGHSRESQWSDFPTGHWFSVVALLLLFFYLWRSFAGDAETDVTSPRVPAKALVGKVDSVSKFTVKWANLLWHSQMAPKRRRWDGVLLATKPLQLSGYRAACNGVQLSVGRVEGKCYIALFF